MTGDAERMRAAARALLDAVPADTDAARLRVAVAAVLAGSGLPGDIGCLAIAAVATELASRRVELHVLAEGETIVYGPDGRIDRFVLAQGEGAAVHVH